MATDSGMKVASENVERVPSIFDKVADYVDRSIQAPFEKLGRTVGTKPRTVMALSLFCALICTPGFSQFQTESRSDKLWWVTHPPWPPALCLALPPSRS